MSIESHGVYKRYIHQFVVLWDAIAMVFDQLQKQSIF